MGRRKLEDQPWYHGMLPREEVINQLKNDGDWLVRCTKKNEQMQIVVSVNKHGKQRHVMLRRNEQGWQMPDKNYSCVYDLITEYRKTGREIAETGLTLKGKGVKKPKWLIPSKSLKLNKMLGAGAFGEVYEGTMYLKNHVEIPVAIKRYKYLDSDDKTDDFLHEAKLMLQYIHPNVVRLYGVVADRPPLKLVMEFCEGGGLDRYLEKRAGSIHVKTKIRFCTQVSRGLEYLAVKKNCVHRDLATRNCLIGNEEEVKVADFGLSKIGNYKIQDLKSASLPIRWSAPDALRGTFTKASDVWSFGVLMWEVFAETMEPYPGKTIKEAYKAIIRGQVMQMPEGKEVPEECEELMLWCWQWKPEERPNITVLRERLEKMATSYDIALREDHRLRMTTSRLSSMSNRLANSTEQSLSSTPTTPNPDHRF